MSRDHDQPGFGSPGRAGTLPRIPWFVSKARWYLLGLALVVGATLSVTVSPLAGNSGLLFAAGAGAAAEVVRLIVRRGTADHGGRWDRRCGIIIWLGLLLFAWFGRASVAREQDHFRARVCTANLNKLCSAVRMYATDHSGVFPPYAQWSDLAAAYVEEDRVFVCPEAPRLSCGYAYNAALSARSVQSVCELGRMVLLFESDRGWNAAGDAALLPAVPRHYGHNPPGLDVYALADGSAVRARRKRLGADEYGEPIWAKQPDVDRLIWEPVLKETERRAGR